MQPSLSDIFNNPETARVDMAESELARLSVSVAHNLSISSVNEFTTYLYRLKEFDMNAAFKLLIAVLERSGGLKSPLIRANNAVRLREFFRELMEDILEALDALED